MAAPDRPAEARSLLGVRGVGEARARSLARLGIETLEDLLLHLPARYEDRRRFTPIGRLRDGVAAAVQGEVRRAGIVWITAPRRRAFQVEVSDGTGTLRARWFHFRGLPRNEIFQPGRRLRLFGTPSRRGRSADMIHPEAEAAEVEDSPSFGRIVPVYPSTEGLSQKVLRRLVGQAVSSSPADGKEFLPAGTMRRQGLPPREECLRTLHLPPRRASLKALGAPRNPWRRRLAFEELLLLQLRLALLRSRSLAGGKGWPMLRREERVEELRRSLPFALTAGQETAYEEIVGDMVSPWPMRRLLQGDVGAGKTLLATMAALVAASNGCQTAFMVPTEILAEQHFLSLKKMMSSGGLRTALLTGSCPAEEKRRTVAAIGGGEVDLVVGTHALIQEQVRFRRLGLSIVDEQHRFGVRQRQALGGKGDRPDVLAMTATPIPRTLALTLYGDFDLTVIDGLPPGRLPVVTTLVAGKDRSEVYEHLRREFDRGRRGYVVLPLVEEGPQGGVGAVLTTAERLRRRVFPGLPVGVVHGRMGIQERAGVMNAFRRGDLSLLVATTVVEVGLDVPEATVMVVENAERFGLSQLHQLRGRVGRGEDPSRCFLLASEGLQEQALRRLEVVAATCDGFQVAEEDLRLRGPGEFIGIRQSGLPRLKVADLVQDQELLAEAREEARRILEKDRGLESLENRGLRERLGSP